MTAREFLRTIWLQEPKKYYEDATCEAMELYAKHKLSSFGRQQERILRMNKVSLEIALKYTEIFQKEYPNKDLHEITEALANEIEQAIQLQAGVKPVDYGTCKNCIFNLEQSETSLVSECQLTIDESTGIGLQFSRDFGCNQWQSR